jgi:hypothetical protein
MVSEQVQLLRRAWEAMLCHAHVVLWFVNWICSCEGLRVDKSQVIVD